MESTIAIDIAAKPDEVYRLATDVEHWPRMLPHYRWVRRLSGSESRRILEMAARRDFYPVRWTALVEPDPKTRRLRFYHVGGPTRGMEVEWRITDRDGGAHVEIWHQFRSRLPLIGGFYATYIAGKIFIDNIAGKTLRGLKQVAESGMTSRT